MVSMDYQDDLNKARNHFKIHKFFLNKLRRLKPNDLDDRFHSLHEHHFRKIDCLQCANCCKTTSPLFIPGDIERLSRTLKMKPLQFVSIYLQVDEEGDYVLRHAPCPFLGTDNKCIVYENRPKACREYPHTNRKRMYQITSLTLQNTLICPAVSRIVHELSKSGEKQLN